MAIVHFRSQIIGGHRSAVAAAAYRHRTAMRDDIDAKVWSYAPDPYLVHAEISAPADAPQWLRAVQATLPVAQVSERLWNAAHAAEVRSDAQIAREFVIALPQELTRGQNLELMQTYVTAEVVSRGFVADWVFHDVPGNPHVHLMHTLRPAVETGFGRKAVRMRDCNGNDLKTAAGEIRYQRFMGTKEDFRALRVAWVDHANRALARADRPERMDARSYADQGADILPGRHLGPALAALKLRGVPSPALVEFASDAAARSAVVSANPDLVLTLVANHKAVFTEADLAKSLHLFIDDPVLFQNALARVLASTELVNLIPSPSPGASHAIYTTGSQLALERQLLLSVSELSALPTPRVAQKHIQRGLEAASAALPLGATLSDEQLAAAWHLTRSGSLAVVIGLAGTGKSTLLAAARASWEGSGVTVHGGALAGIAARSLETSSGIKSRTLASWFAAWERGNLTLQRGDVFVVDEAGMVGTADMVRLVAAIAAVGAKLVLVGDPEQLQPVAAGAPLRQIMAHTGHANLETIVRQRNPAQRAATLALARGQITTALKVYQRSGDVHTLETTDQAIAELTRAYVANHFAGGGASSGASGDRTVLALAPTNALVQRLNLNIRTALIDAGVLAPGEDFATATGPRTFAVGDRVICLMTQKLIAGGRQFQIDNGTTARVVGAARDALTIELSDGTTAEITPSLYPHIDHGYASTIHKAQGVTVDCAYVLATRQLDQSMAYVALSRHRHAVSIYAAQSALDGSLADSLARRPEGGNALDLSAGDGAAAGRVDPSLVDAFAAIRGYPTRDDLAATAAGVIAGLRLRLQHAWLGLSTAVTMAIGRTAPASMVPISTAHQALAEAGIPPAAAAAAATEFAQLLTHRLHPDALVKVMLPPEVPMSITRRFASVLKAAAAVALVNVGRTVRQTAEPTTAVPAPPASPWRHTTADAAGTDIVLRFARHDAANALARTYGYTYSKEHSGYRKVVTPETRTAVLHELFVLRQRVEDLFAVATLATVRAEATAQVLRLGINTLLAAKFRSSTLGVCNLGITGRDGRLVIRCPRDVATEQALMRLGARQVISKAGRYYSLPVPEPAAVPALTGTLAAIAATAPLPTRTGIRAPVTVVGVVRLSRDGDILFVTTPQHPRTTEILAPLNPSYLPGGDIAVRGDVIAKAHVDAVLHELAAYHKGMRVPPTTERPGIDLDHVLADRILSITDRDLDEHGNATLLARCSDMIRDHFGTTTNITATAAGRALTSVVRDDVSRVATHINAIAPQLSRGDCRAVEPGDGFQR